MNKLKVSWILYFLFFNLTSFGQINIVSPNSAEFVKYGRIPVSFFYGIPKISIPLFDINSLDVTLPLTLDYHASGIKTNQMSTWVGLGWNFNPSGSIVRVVNDRPDELVREDIERSIGIGYDREYFGYYYTSNILDKTDWYQQGTLLEYVTAVDEISDKNYIDGAPDEFIINGYGINASFYLYRTSAGELKYKIKSRNGEMFTIMEPIMKRNPQSFDFGGGYSSSFIYNMFYEFTVIKQDGTKLVFGGDGDCIEFFTNKEYSNASGNTGTFYKSTPTSWQLRQIISPKGRVINFIYSRKGSPIIISDVLYKSFVYSPGSDLLNCTGCNVPYPGKSFVIQHPLTLSRIDLGNGSGVDFFSSQTDGIFKINSTDRAYLNSENIINYIRNINTLDGYNSNNKFVKLDSVILRNSQGLTIKRCDFNYIENDNERLKLSDILFRSGTTQNNYKYSLEYNTTKLPSVNSTLSDNWGYYNNKNYRGIDFDQLYAFRSPDTSLMQAEILNKIIYPTGGKTEFEYESNDYSKLATQFPDFAIMNSSGRGGGIRIKNIYDISSTDTIRYNYQYVLEDGITSSGILSGIPRYKAEGRSHVSYATGSWLSIIYLRERIDYEQQFIAYNERNLNALGLTAGNHVTYNRVVESIVGDSNLKKVYNYLNHDVVRDEAPLNFYANYDNVSLIDEFSTREQERGLLSSEIWYKENKITKEIFYKYNDDANRFNDFAKAINKFMNAGVQAVPFVRIYATKLYTYYPFLKQKTEVLYDDLENEIVKNEEHFVYNARLLLTDKKSINSKGEEINTTIKYSSDFFPHFEAAKTIIKFMKEKHIFNLPMEYISIKNDKIISGSYYQYQERNGIIVPFRTYQLPTNLKISDFKQVNIHNGSLKHDDNYVKTNEIESSDEFGNMLALNVKNNPSVGYQWGHHGQYPIVEIINASNDAHIKEINVIRESKNVVYSNNGTQVIFETNTNGDIDFGLTPGLDGSAACLSYYLTGPANRQGSLLYYRLGSPSTQWRELLDRGYPMSVSFSNMPKGKYILNFGTTRTEGVVAGGLLLHYSYPKETINTIKVKDKEFFYEGFEEQTFGISSQKAVGSKYFIGSYVIPFLAPNSKQYLVDYKKLVDNKWVFIKKDFYNGIVLNEGVPIDEVRVYPSDANMTTYTYEPLVGITSKTDPNGNTEYYYYDGFQRLKEVLDFEENVTENYNYHYKP